MSMRFSAYNLIPTGRQLPRTPPAQSCIRTLRFTEDDERDTNRRETFSTPPIRLDSSVAPESLTKGMKDYQMTTEDLQFMQRLKEEKELKKLKDEAATLEADVQRQTMALDLALALRSRVQHELEMLPSCEEIREWLLLYLKVSPSSSDLRALDLRALLVLASESDLFSTVKIEEVLQLEHNRKEEAVGRLEHENLLTAEKILGLMAALAEFKSSMAQQKELDTPLEQQPGDVDMSVKEKPAKSRTRGKNKTPSAKTHEDPATKSKRRNAEKTEQTESQSPEKSKRANAKKNPAAQNKTQDQVADSKGKSRRKLKVEPLSPASEASAVAPRPAAAVAASLHPVAAVTASPPRAVTASPRTVAASLRPVAAVAASLRPVAAVTASLRPVAAVTASLRPVAAVAAPPRAAAAPPRAAAAPPRAAAAPPRAAAAPPRAAAAAAPPRAAAAAVPPRAAVAAPPQAVTTPLAAPPPAIPKGRRARAAGSVTRGRRKATTAPVEDSGQGLRRSKRIASKKTCSQ